MTDCGKARPSAADGPPDLSAVTEYTTLAAGPDVRHELTVRRSRFITVLRRVADEEAARILVTELGREFHDARHHCSAFVLGPERSLRRSNDDGEPSGTAGGPMLDALLKRDTSPPGATQPVAGLSDVCAVVVRYFGGVLLGAGGLVRAYSESVASALDAAVLVRRRRLRLFSVTVAHSEAGRLENELRAAGYAMTGNRYDGRGVKLGVAMDDSPAVISAANARLAALTAGAGEFQPSGTEWADFPFS